MQDLNKPNTTHQYEKIFSGLPADFHARAMDVFSYQFAENDLYRHFTEQLYRSPLDLHQLNQLPYLPVSFFKTGSVQAGSFIPEMIFESSGTSAKTTARHPVKEVALYRESFVKGFEFFYGNPGDYCILGLLPAYLERSGSSLVFMVDELIRRSGHPESGFYLNDFEKLHAVLQSLEKKRQQTLLIGVSFALLDFAEKYNMQLSYTKVMETGGMKGRREELTRFELHDTLKKRLGLSRIHSEYGMTELLSQAYSAGEGIYRTVPWMKALVREEDDPLAIHHSGEGLLNIIDLANRDSCAFLATDDVVRLYEDGSFEVLGRMDNSDLRGCSLMVL